MKIIAIVFITISVILSLIGDIFLKRSGLVNGPDLYIGLFLYTIAAVPIAAVFKLAEFGTVFIIWESSAVILGLVIGILIFQEAVTVSKLMAMILALGAVILSYR